MTLELFSKIANTSTALAILIVCMSFIPFKRRDPKSQLIGLGFLFELIAYSCLVIFTLKGKDINIPQSVQSIFYFLTLTVVYYIALNRRYRKFFVSVALIYVTLAVANLFFGQKNDLNTYSMAIGSFVLLVYCVLYWYRFWLIYQCRNFTGFLCSGSIQLF